MDDSTFRNRPAASAGACTEMDDKIARRLVLHSACIGDADDDEKKIDVLIDDEVSSEYACHPKKMHSVLRPRFKMIVFDKDGTLGNDRDSLRRWAQEMTCRARAEMLQSHCCELSTNDIDRCVSNIHDSIGWDGINQIILPSALLAAGTWEEILAVFARNLTNAMENTRYTEILDKVTSWHAEIGSLHSNDAPIIENLPALMQTCQMHGLLVAVCTSDDRKSTDAALAHWNIDLLVNFSICGDEITNGKPSPDPLLQVCKQTGVEAHECIVVGDTIADTGMARNARAGLCVGVLSGSGERGQLIKTGADLVLSDVGELPQLLNLLLRY